MNRLVRASRSIELLALAALQSVTVASAAPASGLPDVGTLERVERAPPGSLPARREHAVTLAEDALDPPRRPLAVRLFDAIDEDRDGAIDAGEQARARALVGFDFEAIDVDSDGRIGIDEYEAWREQTAPSDR